MSSPLTAERNGASRRLSSLVRDAWWYLPVLVAAGIAARWGVQSVGLVLLALLTAIVMMRLPGWAWASGALGVTILSRIVTSSGLLPPIVDFADFGLIYFGLLTVPFRREAGVGWSGQGWRLSLALSALFAAIWVSWALNPSDVLRPLFTFALWAEPFALVMLLIADPPSERGRRLLMWWFGALVALQIPFAIAQASHSSNGDLIQGTLLRQGAGAHVAAGVTVLGGLALMSWGYSRSLSKGLIATVGAVPVLVVLPLLADAKQVLFALPAAGLVMLVTTPGMARKIGMAAPIAAALAILLLAIPAGKVAVSFLQDTSREDSGKVLGGREIVRDMGSTLSGWAFGLGPANTISRAAFLTTPGYSGAGSPVAALGLNPAPVAGGAVLQRALTKESSSFQSPLSSALGIFGDIGAVGFLAFAWVLISTARGLVRRRKDWMARAALAGWALSLPLAIAYDWWEEPAFGVPLALLTGLALAPALHRSRRHPAEELDLI